MNMNRILSKDYGKELILDLHNCNSEKFTRKMIKEYFIEMCDLIDMQRCKLCWWDDFGLPENKKQTEPHLKGTSAVQFIMTSNITIHTLDIMERVYLNIFSCKDFDAKVVKAFTQKWFGGRVVNCKVITRK
jgi:S-adenosylmethionine/arginine decarboxylase-like enzyme